MSFEEHPAGDNLLNLHQGISLLRRLDDRLYTAESSGTPRGGIGAQVRHCIDFYDCFLRGLPDSRIDYTSRDRERRIETDRQYAVDRLMRIADHVATIGRKALQTAVEVRTEAGSGEDDGWCRSSAARELQFLLSHTVHHYALIAMLLDREGFQGERELSDLGVAPSTLRYWKESGSAIG